MDFQLPNCKTHESRVCDLFCKECSAAICGECHALSHKKHHVDDLEDLCKLRKGIIAQEIERVRHAISLYQEQEQDITVEEKEINDKYRTVDKNIRIHGENLETAARNAKEEYLRQAREKKGEHFKLLEGQKAIIDRNLQKALEMEKAIPSSFNTCEEILSFDFEKLDTKTLPEVPPRQRILPPEFVPNIDHLEKMLDNFGNLAF